MYSTIGINKPKSVNVFNERHKFVKSFNSLRLCAKEYNLGVTTLHRAIHTGKKLGNYYFEYGS